MVKISTVAELLVRIGADGSGLRKELAATQRQMKRAFGPEGMAMVGNIATGVGILGAALGAVGASAVKMAANMEQSRMAFSTMLGSAAAAETMLQSLATFAEKTPFEFAGLVDSTKRLLAYGYTAQEVIPTLTAIGDAVAAMGGSADVLDRVTLAFGQMKAKGFISGEEMRQLAEAGLPAWQMLANAIGKTIPEAMKLAEDKAINAEAAMAGMMEQMASKYGGMMEKQSGTVLGILSNIKDKGGAIMRTLGDEIVVALDLKTRLQGALAFMDDFASRVKSSGVREALMGIIPPELMAGIIAISGAITTVLVVALGKVAVAAALAWGGLLGPIALVGGSIALISTAMWNLSDASSDASQRLRDTAGYMSDIQTEAYAAASAVNALNREIAGNYKAWERSMSGNERRKPGEGSFFPDAPAGGAGPMITGGGGGSGKDPAKEAERISDAIEREWVQTTKTQLDQLNIWRAEHLAKLEETREANEYYERDKERVAATYSARRIKILQSEADASRSLWESMKSGYDQLQSSIKSFGLTGSSKLNNDIDTEQKNRFDGIAKYYEDMQSRFTTADNATKAEILVNLDEKGIAYRLTEQGNLDFTTARQADMLAVLAQTEQKRNEMHQTAADIRAEIDAAYQANSMTMLQAALTEENAIRMNDYAAQQLMLDTWRQSWLVTHQSMGAAATNLAVKVSASMGSAIASTLKGTENIGNLWDNLGKAVRDTIADMVAAWIEAQLKMAAMNFITKVLGFGFSDGGSVGDGPGGGGGAKMAGGGSVFGRGTSTSDSIPAWLSTGEYVINAKTVDRFGLGFFDAINSGLMPAFAAGGIVTGPSLSSISAFPGKNLEPQSFERSLAKALRVGATQEASGEVSVVQHNYGDYNFKTDIDEVNDSLAQSIRFAMMGG